MKYKYVLDDWTYTKECFEKLRIYFNIRSFISDEDVKKEYTFLNYIIPFLISDLENDFSLGTKIFPAKYEYNDDGTISIGKMLNSSKQFHRYLVNQTNHFLGQMFNDFNNNEDFIKAVVNEKTKFYVSYNLDGIDQMVEMIENEKDPDDAFQFLNTQLYRMINNQGLLEILPDGAENYYLKFLSSSKDFLKDRIRNDSLTSNNISSIIVSDHNSKTLKSLFKDINTYSQLIEFMSIEKLVLIGQGVMTWKGFRSNRKFELASFYEALFSCGYLRDRERINDKELCVIISNTFIGLEISYKTIRNGDYNKFTDYYVEMLSRFSQSQLKASEPSAKGS